MAPPAQTCCMLLYLTLLCNAQHFLTMHPQNPLVPLGGSVQLNCSINCPRGITTWKGLDTNLGGLYTAQGHSVLTISNATISMEGTRICVGSCPGKKGNFQRSLNLQVYALPDSLLLTPHPDEDTPSLSCSMRGVYPGASVSLSCYRGSVRLETPSQSQEMEEDEEGLSSLSWSLGLPREEGWVPGVTYRCEAQLAVGDQVLRREGTLQLPARGYPNTELEMQKGSTQGNDPETYAEKRVTESVTQRHPKTPTATSQGLLTESVTHNDLKSTKSTLTTVLITGGTPTGRSVTRRDPTSLSTTPSETPTALPRIQVHPKRWDPTSLPATPSVTPTALPRTQVNPNRWDPTSLPATPSMTPTALPRTQVNPNRWDPTSLPAIPSVTPTALPRTQVNPNRWDPTSLPAIPSETPTALPRIQVHPKRRDPTSLPFAPRGSLTSRYITSRVVPAVEEVLTSVTSGDGLQDSLAPTWMLLSTLGLAGSLLLSLQLWRRMKRKRSFQPKHM
ncbi:mucosal addressin cell adhesion molecule 1 isoform X2 [Ascaphus truei]|uniref:mucosal addressin cell adhesion molecule 1 isoform X2 n=1 Tax=Ascaphus truei TaxID=8439 RepID=UPI003F5998F6